MANSDYSYYFTVVIYEEFRRLEKLLELGNIYQSPIHYHKNKGSLNQSTTIMEFKNDWIPYGYKGEKKPHQHILIKTSNRMTANKFIQKLSEVLGNDFTGIAVKKDDVLVQKVEMMLRYFYHLDSPTKEHFNITTAFESVAPCFTREVVSAFSVEITHIITENILLGNFHTMRDILEYNSYSLVFEEYMRCTKNLYYINSFFKDERFLEQKKKEKLRDDENQNFNRLPY